MYVYVRVCTCMYVYVRGCTWMYVDVRGCIRIIQLVTMRDYQPIKVQVQESTSISCVVSYQGVTSQTLNLIFNSIQKLYLQMVTQSVYNLSWLWSSKHELYNNLTDINTKQHMFIRQTQAYTPCIH